MIVGSGNSTLDDRPDMYIGEMTIPGHIGPTECRSVSRAALVYPNPGPDVTEIEMPQIPFKGPSGGNCFAKKS